MSIYAIADLHLSFASSVEKPMDIYGPRWHDHAQRLHDNWCSRITDDDTVIIAGDISWGLKLEEAKPDLGGCSSRTEGDSQGKSRPLVERDHETQ